MKKIIVLILCIAAMSVSVSAQGYFPKHHLPARGYADPYSHSWSSGRSGVKRFCEPQRGRGYRPPRESKIGKAAYVASEILRGIVIADRIFAPYCTDRYYSYFDSHAPNRWVYGRPGMPFYPYRYMNQAPFYWYPTGCGNTVFYTSSNCCMAVTLDDQLQLIRYQNKLYIWDTRGSLLAQEQLYAGYHSHMELSTGAGIRLAEIFYDGVCRVNYLDTAGNVIESYELY